MTERRGLPAFYSTLLAAAGLWIVPLAVPATGGEAAPPAAAEASPSDRPAVPETNAPAVPETPAPCCPTACIRYRHHRLGKTHCCCDCRPPVQVVLEVQDPCSCCTGPVQVPVCVPACCDGAPTVCPRVGLFGRCVVDYRWCCGYHVQVVFGRCGQITVHTYGR